jgi:streptogramin lyase
VLYVADADNSAVRAVRFLDLQVKTLAGAGPWEFGDADGLPAAVRLQYPTACAVDPGGSILWVCDTFNNKVKALSLRGGGVRTLALPYRFHEPGGIAVAQGSLWIANTNAHEIVRIDTGSGVIKRLPVAE